MVKGLTILIIASALVQCTSGACLAGNQATQLRVMPVSSWGGGQGAVDTVGTVDTVDTVDHVVNQSAARKSSNNNGRQIALALPPSKESKTTANKLGQAKTLSASASATSRNRDIDEALDLVTVTAKRLAKEGGMRFGEYSRWFSALFKQQLAPPVITPAAPNYATRKLSHAQPVTEKHPLWMLRDGRLKTVTVQ